MTTWVFCYGSNSTAQLRERVGNPALQSHACFLPGHRRIFAGYSERWQGAAASLITHDRDDVCCVGSAVQLTKEEMERLDRFEGISVQNDPFDHHPEVNVYRRAWVDIVVVHREGTTEETKEVKQQAIAYVKNDHVWKDMPSEAYLQACWRNIQPFWPQVDGQGFLDVYNAAGDLMGQYAGPAATSSASSSSSSS